MRILLLISALSVFCPVICQCSSQHSWPSSSSSNSKHNLPHGANPNSQRKPQYDRVYRSGGYIEALFWHKNQLFFADTYGYKLCSLHEENLNVFCATIIQGHVTFAAVVRGTDNQFVVGAGNQIILITWDSSTEDHLPGWKNIAVVDENIPGNVLDYGTIDPYERLLFGTTNTAGHSWANVTSLNQDLLFKRQITDVVTSSGFVIDKYAVQPTKLYFVDAKTYYNILAYNYHKRSGYFKKPTVVFNWERTGMPGNPRRLTVDMNGDLWVPIYEGGKIIKVDPRLKRIIRSIDIPALRVGACVFGGPNHDVLYVSTIGYGHKINDVPRPQNDEGGTIFAFRDLGVRGWSAEHFKLDVAPSGVQYI